MAETIDSRQETTLQKALEHALDQVEANTDAWKPTAFPEPASDDSFTYS
jgi:hypothetical protein